MVNVWGIHMPEWVGDDPVERSYVSIGWPKLGDILEIPANREDFKQSLVQAYPEKKAGAIAKSRFATGAARQQSQRVRLRTQARFRLSWQKNDLQ